MLILAVESKLLKNLLPDEQFLNGTSAQCTIVGYCFQMRKFWLCSW